MITLIKFRFKSARPDLLDIKKFEDFCAQNSTWNKVEGPLLIAPVKISSRFYSLLHIIFRPLLKNYKRSGAIVSLGLPYFIYLFSKTFPDFSFNYDLRVLWTWDVWQPKYDEIEKLVRRSKINLLLLSSYQATDYFRKLSIPNCEVHWVHETIDTDEYQTKPWNERSVHILSFGRSYSKYHNKIIEGCDLNNINYKFHERKDGKDVAIQGVKPSSLQFSTWPEFKRGLSDAQICICFPKALTHPEVAGEVSTVTLRYLQAMASKCLLIGSAPLDMKYLFDYNPVIEVDWNDPVGQLVNILENPEPYFDLIERNYETVCKKFHYRNGLEMIDQLTNDSLSRIKKNVLV